MSYKQNIKPALGVLILIGVSIYMFTYQKHEMYSLEELDNQSAELIYIYKAETDYSRKYLYLFENQQYIEKENIIYSCGAGVDFSLGPWNEKGRYRMEGKSLFLYPSLTKERRIYNPQKIEYEKKFSLPNTLKREYALDGDACTLIDLNSKAYYLRDTLSR